MYQQQDGGPDQKCADDKPAHFKEASEQLLRFLARPHCMENCGDDIARGTLRNVMKVTEALKKAARNDPSGSHSIIVRSENERLSLCLSLRSSYSEIECCR